MRLIKCLLAVLLAVFIMGSSMGLVVFATGSGSDESYILTVDDTVIIEDNDTPLATVQIYDEYCCILHLVIMLSALAIAVYYVRDQKKCQQREFELRRELSR